MLARRFALPPVNEASYEPRQIPNAKRDMEGTVLIRPARETWLKMLGEMVQMVNEGARRDIHAHAHACARVAGAAASFAPRQPPLARHPPSPGPLVSPSAIHAAACAQAAGRSSRGSGAPARELGPRRVEAALAGVYGRSP